MIVDILSLLASFYNQFPTEQACIDALTRAKWPNGYRCPRCNCSQAYLTKTRRLPLYECFACRHQTTATVGTVLEGSRTELKKWFAAFFLISNHRNGISAVRLQKLISVTYKTAWLMLSKIRYSLSQADHNVLLQGSIYVNISELRVPDPGRMFSFDGKRYPIVIGGEFPASTEGTNVFAAAPKQSEPTRIKIKTAEPITIANGSILSRYARELFLRKHATAGPDGNFTLRDRYGPQRCVPLMIACRNVARWIYTTFCGVGAKHLQAYLDEYCFRANEGLGRIVDFVYQRDNAFIHMLNVAATTVRLTYRQITSSSAAVSLYLAA